MAGQLEIGGTEVVEILDSLAEAVTVRHLDGELIYANRKALDSMGFATIADLRSRPIGNVFDDYLVQDESGHVLSMSDLPGVRLLSGTDPEPLVIRTIARSSGETRWEILKSSPLRDEHGTTIAAVTIIEDITLEKEAERRERFLAAATDTLMSSLDYEETLRNVGWLAVPQLADWCAVDLLDGRGFPQRVVVAHRDPDKLALAEQLQRYAPREPDPEQGLGRVLRTGETELYEEISEETLIGAAHDPEHLRLLRAVGFRSVLLVPLRARGRTLGAFTLVTSESLRRFGPEDQEFAQQLAQRVALAVDNARLVAAQRAVAETLQRNLLPDRVPAIAGWQIATLYRAADSAEGVEVGGDFFDFVEGPGGWLVLLGDVTGRGLAASAMTLLLRHGARFVGRQEGRPGVILAQVNDALRDQAELSLCSAICVRLRPGGFAYSSAGHPAPLLIRSSGAVEELASRGPILGAWVASWPEDSVEAGPGDTLLMYTDGLTELKGERDRFGTERLRVLLEGAAGASPDQLISELQRTLDLFAADEQADDTAVIALRYLGRENG